MLAWDGAMLGTWETWDESFTDRIIITGMASVMTHTARKTTAGTDGHQHDTETSVRSAGPNCDRDKISFKRNHQYIQSIIIGTVLVVLDYQLIYTEVP